MAPASTGAGDAASHRDDRRRLGQAAGRGGLVVERGHAVQPAAGPPGQAVEGRRPRRRRVPDRVHDHRRLRRHLDGPRGHAGVARVPRGHRRLGRDRDARRAVRCPGHLRRVRQEPARDAHGRRPGEPAVGVPLRRVDPPGPAQGQGHRHRHRVRGGRCLRRRHHGPPPSSERSSGEPARARAAAPACSRPTRWRRWPRPSACRCRGRRPRRPPTAAATTSPTSPAGRSSTCSSWACALGRS